MSGQRSIVAVCMVLIAPAVFAGEADVVAATAERTASGTYTVTATIRHADTGWDHYANRFEVLGPDGAIISTRVLAHPHVDEQPFTRSLVGVQIDAGIRTVTIRAHDSVHGYGGKVVEIVL